MKIKGIVKYIFVLIICLFFLTGCIKQADNLPIDELREILEKNETNYTFIIKMSMAKESFSESIKYKLESILDENGAIIAQKVELDYDDRNMYYIADDKVATAISLDDGVYVGKQSKSSGNFDDFDLSFFKSLIINNLELFSYDNNKKYYTGVIVNNDGGKEDTMEMKLSVADGHLLYFEAYNRSTTIKFSYEFKDYGKTKVKIPTYFLDGKIIYEENAGKMTLNQWNNFFKYHPLAYTLNIKTTDLLTKEVTNRSLNIDYTKGKILEEKINNRDCIFTMVDNEPIVIQDFSGFKYGVKCDQEFIDYLEFLHTNYLSQSADFTYNNEIAGYTCDRGSKKISVFFEDYKLKDVQIEDDYYNTTYSFTYKNPAFITIPEYILVDEFPDEYPLFFSKGHFNNICNYPYNSYKYEYTNQDGIKSIYTQCNKIVRGFVFIDILVLEQADQDPIYYKSIRDELYQLTQNADGKWYPIYLSETDMPLYNVFESYASLLYNSGLINYNKETDFFSVKTDDGLIYFNFVNNDISSIIDMRYNQEIRFDFIGYNNYLFNLPTYSMPFKEPFATKGDWDSMLNTIFDVYQVEAYNVNTETKVNYNIYQGLVNKQEAFNVLINCDAYNIANYYTLIDNETFKIVDYHGNYMADDSDIDINDFKNAKYFLKSLNFEDFAFNSTEGCYYPLDGSPLKIFFDGGKLSLIEAIENGEVLRYRFTYNQNTKVTIPKKYYSSIQEWWETSIQNRHYRYTLKYEDEINPENSFDAKFGFHRSAAEPDGYFHIQYIPFNGEEQYYSKLIYNEYRSLQKIGTLYYLQIEPDFDISQYEPINSYLDILLTNFNLFSYDPAADLYKGVIDGITYSVDIINGYITKLYIDNGIGLIKFDYSNINATDINFPRYISIDPDLETKPDASLLEYYGSDEFDNYSFSNSRFDYHCMIDVMPYMENGVKTGYIMRQAKYWIELEDQSFWVHDYIIDSTTEQYTLIYNNGFSKSSLNLFSNLKYITRVVDLGLDYLKLFIDNYDLIIYDKNKGIFYLGVDNIIYSLELKESGFSIIIEEKDDYKMVHFSNIDQVSFELPAAERTIQYSEFSELTKNIPLNFKAHLNASLNQQIYDLDIECQFIDGYEGIIKIIDGDDISYYDGEKMYQLVNGEIEEKELNIELINFIFKALDAKKKTLNFVRLDFISRVKYQYFPDRMYSAVIPTRIIEQGADGDVSINFKIIENHIAYFKIVNGDDYIIINCTNYGEVTFPDFA